MEAVLPELASSVIKTTSAGAGSGAVLGRYLTRRAVDEWAGRIARRPDDYTVQAYQPLSQMPTWKDGRLVPRSAMLRVFVVSDGPQSWRVLPGGLTRIAAGGLAAPVLGADVAPLPREGALAGSGPPGLGEAEIASMQRGGSSADTWVLTEGAVDTTSLLRHEHPAADTHSARVVTSRSAENLFWLGRYTERTENTARLARLALQTLRGEDQAALPVLAWLGELAAEHGLVLPDVPAPTASRRVFERSLVAALGDAEGATSVGFNLRALRDAASAVRDRLSQEHWNLIVRAGQAFRRGCGQLTHGAEYSSVEALRVLEQLSEHTAAMTGAQTDRMMRDDGWRLLSTGRHLERLAFLSSALAAAFETGAVHTEAGYEAVVALFDSTITFHAQYQQRHDVAALLDLLVLDRDNPRSLAWVAQTLRGRLARLEGSDPGRLPDVAQGVPDPAAWSLEPLCAADGQGHTRLLALLGQCLQAAWQLSDELGARYFTHSVDQRLSVGA